MVKLCYVQFTKQCTVYTFYSVGKTFPLYLICTDYSIVCRGMSFQLRRTSWQRSIIDYPLQFWLTEMLARQSDFPGTVDYTVIVSWWCNVWSILLDTAHFTWYAKHFTLITAHCTLHRTHCTGHTAHKLHTSNYTLNFSSYGWWPVLTSMTNLSSKV